MKIHNSPNPISKRNSGNKKEKNRESKNNSAMMRLNKSFGYNQLQTKKFEGFCQNGAINSS
jgi:hypothetical protein